MTYHLKKQQGAAIIVALFVVALVSIAAVAMLNRMQIDMRRTMLLTGSIQGNFYAQGSLAWAMEQLNNNLKHKQDNRIVDATPIQSPISHVDNATIFSVIEDAQGRFNLNNLINLTYEGDFIRLIHIVNPKTDMLTAFNITLAVMNWISSYASSPVLDEYYAKLNPPYRSPHRLMTSVSELRLVKGVTPELFAALEPYITALPETTPININNAEIPILQALSPTLTAEAAKNIISQRRQTPFVSTQSFLQFDVVKNNPFPEDKITVLSSYFLVKTNVTVGQQETILYTLLHRLLKNSQVNEVIIWQSKGTL